MERHRERYNEHHDPNRNSQSGNSSSWSSDDHRPNFSGDHHFNHHHHHHHMNTETPHDSFGYNSVRKRGFHHSARRTSPDHIDGGGSVAKLYVAPIPRTAIEDDIRPLFEEHGNVVEVVLPKDKRSGLQQGYCFVKYAACEEASLAILTLNNRYTFPGELAALKVRYADGDRERLGPLPDKLYVGCMNKHTSKEDIDEVFSPYGHVEDIYIVRDELKQNRGFGFVQFSHREMALAAIKALHGIYTMRGCDQPLIVRLANPKKPRTGELRGNYAYGSPNFGPHSQEPVARPASNFGDSMGGHVVPNASQVQQISTNSQPQAAFHWANQEPAPPSAMQQPHLIQPSTQNLEQQQNLQVTRQESSWTGGNCQTVANILAAPAVPRSPQTVDPLECDWSEHTCPDGYKYYYNCVTCESRWRKPEEFALFQQQLQKQSKLQNFGQQLHSPSPGLSHQVAQTQKELDRVQIQSETSPIISPTCV